MMSLDEIRNATINPIVAREAYDQAEKRLLDVLDTKKAFEQKAFALFSGYLTVSLALFGVGGAVFKEQGLIHLVPPFWIVGGIYMVGAISFVLALADSKYGALASDPKMWLLRGTIDGPDTTLPLMHAYITYYHQERIDRSTKANNRKAGWIRAGIILGVAGPVVLFAQFLLPPCYSLYALLH